MNFLLVSVVFGVIQIGLWSCLPNPILRFMFKVPLLAILANILGSYMIMKIAGTSAFIGSANLTGSLIFAGWILTMKGASDEGISS